jgi:TonB family protein
MVPIEFYSTRTALAILFIVAALSQLFFLAVYPRQARQPGLMGSPKTIRLRLVSAVSNDTKKLTATPGERKKIKTDPLPSAKAMTSRPSPWEENRAERPLPNREKKETPTTAPASSSAEREARSDIPARIEEEGRGERLIDHEPLLAPAPVVERESETHRPVETEEVKRRIGQLFQQHLARIDLLSYYPRSSRRKREEGVVIIGLVLTETAVLSRLRLLRSGGHPKLDLAAIRLMNDQKERLRDSILASGISLERALQLSVPIRFHLP